MVSIPALIAFSAKALPTIDATSILVPLAFTSLSLEDAATKVVPVTSFII